ncbi:UNVERIFIED_CONTAM: Secreted RxLR effector protein [Sesamum calycinum]|uniref:Secreted RxLR effector protein n=1 Tax=Sesamum calycinum TaxID=2727403 RepID=A0AAW2K0J0_9LAMI
METNKFNDTNYNYWLRNMRIVPNFENQGLSWTSRFQRPGLRGPLPKNVSRSRNDLRTTQATASTKGAPAAADEKGKGKGKVRGSQRLKANDVCMNCQGKGYWKKECPQLLSNPGIFVIEVNMITNAASWILDTGCGAHICNSLQVLGRSTKLNVCGPLNTPARRGFSHFITFTDDHSRYGYVYLMGKSLRPLEGSRNTDLKLRIKLANKIKTLLSDRGGEYLSGEFIDYLKEIGILSQWTPPGTPQLNGGYLETAAKFLNMAPSKTVPQTPYEIWHGKPTSYKYLRMWGSSAYVKRLVGDKLDSRSSLCRESRPPERYGFMGLTNQLDNNPNTYGEAMSDIDSDKWLEAMKSKMDSIVSNQMDVKMAFLNGYVEEEIFMDQSEDFNSVGEEQKDMGEASYILGIKIYRDRSRKMLGLTQSSYIEKVLKRFKMENSKRGFLPMRHGIKLSKKQSLKTYEELKRMLDIPYTSVVGSIQYVVQCTRLDVAYALSITSGYQACAGETHLMVKQFLKGYSDANFQSDDDDAKSQSGFVFKLNGGVVAWKSSKQATTTDSTTEAEYITTLEVVWMKNYIQELGWYLA